jgi:hypothetical protein
MTALAPPIHSKSGLPQDPAPKRARGRPRKTEDERDDGNRRHQLLTAAARLFREKGFDATSTRDIAAAVGMHSGSPFYHFKSKDAKPRHCKAPSRVPWRLRAQRQLPANPWCNSGA